MIIYWGDQNVNYTNNFLDADLADDADSYVFVIQNPLSKKKLSAQSASSASKKFAGFAFHLNSYLSERPLLALVFAAGLAARRGAGIVIVIIRRGGRRDVHGGLARLLRLEHGTDSGTGGHGRELHPLEEVLQLLAGDKLDVDAGDMVRGEGLGILGALAADLQAELAQFAEVHLVAGTQGVHHVVHGGNDDGIDVGTTDGGLTGDTGTELAQSEFTVHLSLGVGFLRFVRLGRVRKQTDAVVERHSY